MMSHKPKEVAPYAFNNEVAVEGLEVQDSNKNKYQFLNMVDCGTCYQVMALVKVGEAQPSAVYCLEMFMRHWVSWAGWPEAIATDRSLHNILHFWPPE